MTSVVPYVYTVGVIVGIIAARLCDFVSEWWMGTGPARLSRRVRLVLRHHPLRRGRMRNARRNARRTRHHMSIWDRCFAEMEREALRVAAENARRDALAVIARRMRGGYDLPGVP